MSKTKLIIFTILLFVQSNIAFSETIKYLNISKIMNDSKAGKFIIIELNKENKKLSTIFKKQEDNFKIEENKIISQKNILEKKELDKKIQLLRNKINIYNKEKLLKLKDLEKKKIKAQQNLIIFINEILVGYMDKNSISFILKQNSIFVGKKELDITNEILTLIDKKITKIEIE